MARSDWPIVVGGCHRSGTSVVRRILDAHPRIHCGPEVTFLRDLYGDYFHDPLNHLRFTQTARSLVPEEEVLEVVGAAFVELHERAARAAGKARWADKAPENVLYGEQWQRLLGNRWLMVHVVRNPLDTLSSMAEARFPFTLPADLEGRIAFYRRYTEAGLRFGKRHPGRYRRVVYEALCESPEEAVAELMAWTGEPFDPGQLHFDASRHDSGLEDPKVAKTSEIHAASVGRWPDVLSKRDAAEVWSRTADLWSRLDPEGAYDPHEPRPLASRRRE